MYRGFNLKLEEKINQDYYERGMLLFKDHKSKIKKVLDGFFLDNGSLSGTKIMENWFPHIGANIFLSHSHNDEKEAITLAGLLSVFGLTTFIDSCIWGYSTDLLEQIDERYCLNIDGQSYNYTKRNYSTSHVNLMLSNALNRMIDNCECIFFLNTPNSISASEAITRTKSPWIFSEIGITQTIRKQTPDRLKRATKIFSDGGVLNEERKLLTIEYDLELAHLQTLNFSDLEEWIDNAPISNPEKALDNLYHLNPIKRKFLV